MKYSIESDMQPLSLTEVAEQLQGCGALQLEADERTGEVRLECGTDLEIDIIKSDPMDRRIDGFRDRTETFTISDIREHFTAADYYTWAKDENGDDVLLCFGC